MSTVLHADGRFRDDASKSADFVTGMDVHSERENHASKILHGRKRLSVRFSVAWAQNYHRSQGFFPLKGTEVAINDLNQHFALRWRTPF